VVVKSYQTVYTLIMKNEGAGNGVACRLVLPDGRVVEWVMDGPLVAMPAKATKKGAKRDGR
jgi:hypothetical protein